MANFRFIVSTCVAGIVAGCTSPPNLDPFLSADTLVLQIDDDPSSYHASTEIARLADAERQRQIVDILSKYESQWKPIWTTAPYPSATLVALRDDEFSDLIYLSWPIRDDDTTVYFQKKKDGGHIYVYISRSDALKLMQLMNVAESDVSPPEPPPAAE